MILLPPKPFIEIPKYYNLVDIGIILEKPSEDNKISTSSKTFEYMLYGIPFISVDCIEMNRKIIEKYKCGLLVRWGDIDDIIKKLEILIIDKDLRKNLGKNGKNAIVKEYNWDLVEKKLLSSYLKFIEKDHQRKVSSKSLN